MLSGGSVSFAPTPQECLMDRGMQPGMIFIPCINGTHFIQHRGFIVMGSPDPSCRARPFVERIPPGLTFQILSC
jgi:hypothetical protein